MKEVKELHEQAMQLVDQAFIAKKEGNTTLAESLTTKAFKLELKAANLLKDRLDVEPTRSILYRSAASLAIDCGNSLEAIGIASEGLRGKPPIEIGIELEILLQVAKNNLEFIHPVSFTHSGIVKRMRTNKLNTMLSSSNVSSKKNNSLEKSNK